ncbi:MAG: hypothetical protein ACJAWL_001314 [Motiliproteus sp.]|jgi:uncharacterized protein (DUF58 family)
MVAQSGGLLLGWVSGLLSGLRRRLRQRVDAWLRKRLPRSRSVTLDQRRIFIMPTRNGLYFLLMTAVLFFGGINYGNSLILLVALLLVSLFLVSILHTFANLAGLTLEAGRTRPVFAGDEAAVGIRLGSCGRAHESIQLSWPGAPVQCHDLLDSLSCDLSLMLPVRRRGLCRPPRLRVESRYPLGLLRAWSWVALDSQCLVYPKAIENRYPSHQARGDGRGEPLAREGSDDFDGLRRYQAGDNPRRIAWKSYAREGRLYSKRFASDCAQEQWLEWDAYPGLAQETRLSRLCYWVLRLDRQQRRFGLRLPGVELLPASGDAHRLRCLKALALFGLEADSEDVLTAAAPSAAPSATPSETGEPSR